MAIAARRDHAVAVAEAAVAFGAVNREALLSAVQYVSSDGHRETVHILPIGLARRDDRIHRQLATRDGSRNARPRRHPIGKEITRLERIVAGLVGHFLTTGKKQKAESRKQKAEDKTTPLPPRKSISAFCLLPSAFTRAHRSPRAVRDSRGISRRRRCRTSGRGPGSRGRICRATPDRSAAR